MGRSRRSGTGHPWCRDRPFRWRPLGCLGLGPRRTGRREPEPPAGRGGGLARRRPEAHGRHPLAFARVPRRGVARRRRSGTRRARREPGHRDRPLPGKRTSTAHPRPSGGRRARRGAARVPGVPDGVRGGIGGRARARDGRPRDAPAHEGRTVGLNLDPSVRPVSYARSMDRAKMLRRATWLSVASIVLSGMTGLAGVSIALTTGALSLLGFGFDAAIDSIASGALVWRFRLEGRDPERADRAEHLAERI